METATIESEHQVPSESRGEPEPRPPRAAPRPGRWPPALPLFVLVVGAAVTAALALGSLALYNDNEARLLRLRVREAGSVVTASVPSIQTPLASTAELVQATNGDVAKFRTFVTPYVGPPPAHEFQSLSLWRAGAGAGPIATVGAPPVLPSMPEAEKFIAHAARSPLLSVIGLLRPPSFSLGYAYAPTGSTPGFVVYAENPLPRSRHAAIASNSAFSDLNYAIYLGRSRNPSQLLLTSVAHPPLRGRTAVDTVPFGDSAFTLVMAPRRPLSGTLPQRLPWIILVVGCVLTLGAAAMTLRLIRRRRDAEQLAGRLERIASENRRLYAEQRDIAETLQHALLPESVPEIRGAEAAARYEASGREVQIGGDWYDVIVLDDRKLLLVVGDVSGHGLRAAATMATLRYAIHAYALQGDSPSLILSKLSRLVNVATSGQLATVLCMMVDVQSRRITVTSAGHLPPLLIGDGTTRYLALEVGAPVGVDGRASYQSTTESAPPGATLLAFTDGLVERRGEHLDQGMERLRNVAATDHTDLPELFERLVTEVRNDPAEDDTAIVGLRWVR